MPSDDALRVWGATSGSLKQPHRWIYGAAGSGKFAEATRHLKNDFRYTCGSPTNGWNDKFRPPDEGVTLLVDVLFDSNPFGQSQLLDLLFESNGSVILLSDEAPDKAWGSLFGNIDFASIKMNCDFVRCFRKLNEPRAAIENRVEVMSSLPGARFTSNKSRMFCADAIT